MAHERFTAASAEEARPSAAEIRASKSAPERRRKGDEVIDFDVITKLRLCSGNERAELLSLAATIAAGIEANTDGSPTEEATAQRAVRIACEIVKAVAP
jgi:hypothetical protein